MGTLVGFSTHRRPLTTAAFPHVSVQVVNGVQCVVGKDIQRRLIIVRCLKLLDQLGADMRGALDGSGYAWKARQSLGAFLAALSEMSGCLKPDEATSWDLLNELRVWVERLNDLLLSVEQEPLEPTFIAELRQKLSKTLAEVTSALQLWHSARPPAH